MKIFTPLLFAWVVACLSCTNTANSPKALLSDQLLAHYVAPEDSLKRRAARYLLDNMEEQYHIPVAPVQRYYRQIDSIRGLRIPLEQQENMALSLFGSYRSQISLLKDSETLSAEFLIKNIDAAFALWENKPWAQHLGFDQFCEYLLPYKVKNNQVLDHWREYYSERFPLDEDPFLHTLPYRNSALKACDLLNREIRAVVTTQRRDPLREELLKWMLPTGLLRLVGENCDVDSYVTALAMRSAGIPVAIDYTPQWPHIEQGHSWNVLLATSGREIAFSGPYEDVDRLHNPWQKIGKVYRETYRVNPDVKRLHQSGQWIPEDFKNPCILDVTPRYGETVSLSLPLETPYKMREQFAWIAHFSIHGWRPVGFGEVKSGWMHFTNLSKGVLYLPAAVTPEQIIPLSHPFILTLKGAVHLLKPDTQNLCTVMLTRKYPVRANVYEAAQKTAGGALQASNDAAFRNYTVIHTLPGRELAGETAVADTNRYRYWRYFSPDSGYCNLAELAFYGTEHQQVEGKVIGTDEPGDAQSTKYAVFDGDPLTSYRSVTDPRAWVGVDFGTARRLTRITYTPRTDGNNIQIGDEYELFCHDIRGWRSLGKKRADSETLTYDNVPANALLWLRDLTKGKEERPFTYENGEQVWW